MVFSPSMGYLQQSAVLGAEGTDAKKLDLSYVTPEAFLAAVARPHQVLTAPEMEMLPIEVISAAGKQELGIDPLDVQEVLAIVEVPQGAPPGFGVVVRFSKPHQLNLLMKSIAAETVESELAGRPYLQGKKPMDPGLFMPDDRTLLIGHDPVLRKMVANRAQPAAGPLAKLLASTDTSSDFVAVATIEPVREMASAALSQAPVPPPLVGLKRLPQLLSAAKAQANLTGKMDASLVLVAPDEASAEQLEGLISQLIDFGRQMALTEMTKQVSSDDPVEQAMVQYMQRINQRMFDALRPVRRGKVVRFSHDGSQLSQPATVGILIALLLPAVQAAREAARRAQSSNNLKQIGVAMHNHHAAKGRFPAHANFDGNGRPLLSWRVHILPFLEHKPLYDQFRLDEPWDSPHNKRLIPMMPPVYRNPSSPAGPTKADYLVPLGKGLMFGGKEGSRLPDITDGSSNTIVALEVDPDQAVVWTKPDDWRFDANRPLARLGKAHPKGFLALFADGHVQFLADDIDPGVFQRLLTIAGGEVVDRF
jgi:hypothetical protein